MNHPVSLETGRVFVGLPTVATLVWSAGQKERSVSSLGTTTTYVGQNIAGFFFLPNWELFLRRLLLPDVAVCSDVSVEVGGVTECLVAVRTLVRGG